MGFFKTDQEKRAKNFRKAIARNDIAALKQAISEGIGPDTRDESRDQTPLYLAAYTGAVESVKFFLDLGADPNFTRKDGATCLITAARYGHVEVAKLLLARGADLKARTHSDEWTALHWAAHNGRGSLVKLLLEAGGDANAVDKDLRKPSDVIGSCLEAVKKAMIVLFSEGQDKDQKPGGANKKEEEIPARAEAASVGNSPAPEEGWRLTGKHEVTNISAKEDIGYRLTEIFNFRAGTYARIAQNLQTGAESQTLRFFDEFTNPSQLERAREALRQLGGTEPADSGARKLDKPALPGRQP